MDSTTIPVDPSTAPFTIGADVACSDGTGGRLARVIIDPVARTLTHLVVQSQDGRSRLVPVALVASADPDMIALRCDAAEFDHLDSAEETHFVSAARDDFGYPASQVSLMPYFPLGTGMGGSLIGGYGGLDPANPAGPEQVVYERIPLGNVQVRRGERVHAQDGDIGRVQGLVVDPADNHVTHVLLEEGHLWGKKDVSIPIRAVTCTADGLEVGLSKDEVRDLPSVEVEHPDWLAH